VVEEVTTAESLHIAGWSYILHAVVEEVTTAESLQIAGWDYGLSTGLHCSPARCIFAVWRRFFTMELGNATLRLNSLDSASQDTNSLWNKALPNAVPPRARLLSPLSLSPPIINLLSSRRYTDSVTSRRWLGVLIDN